MKRVWIAAVVATLAACGGGGSTPSASSLSSAVSPTGLPSDVELAAPEDLVFEPNGTLVVSDFMGNFLASVDADGSLTSLAGDGTAGSSGDGGPSQQALVNEPAGMTIDAGGDLVFADHRSGCIRKIDASGMISSIAGRCGHEGFSGDEGPATRAKLNDPIGIAYDTSGDLIIADEQNARVRMIDTAGTITTIAGGGDQEAAPGVLATAARLGHPSYVVIKDGAVVFSDFTGERVWMIDPEGKLAPVAGNGETGYAGDGGDATKAELSFPTGLALDAAGNLFVSDANNNVVRMIDANGVITTVVGTGDAGNDGDGGQATGATLNAPAGLTFDQAGILYIADQGSGLIRKFEPKTGVVSLVAG